MEENGSIELAIYAPVRYSPTDRLRDQAFSIADKPHPRPPGGGHHMGTDVNRSDVLSRMIHASRIAMSIGFISTGLSLVIGVIVGAIMGYYVGWVDLLGMRILEVFSSIPTLFLMLAAVAFFGRNLYIIMLIIGLTSWVGIARFVRAEFLKLRKVDYVMAAVALGLPLRSILFRHLLPNALAPVLVSVSFGVASAILAESSLSFLGLGLIDEPSWGAMLNQAVGSTGGFQWWLALFPGMAIFLTVLSYNLVGEALRDALDPKLLQRE
jgi:peptide/nickel transport system permease protein